MIFYGSQPLAMNCGNRGDALEYWLTIENAQTRYACRCCDWVSSVRVPMIKGAASIRTYKCIVNAIIGAQRRLASLGSKIEQEYGQPIDRLFRETIRVILMGLRAPETAAPHRRRKKQNAATIRNRKSSL